MRARNQHRRKATVEKVPSPTAQGAARSYREKGNETEEEHTVDDAVERRLDDGALRRRIRAATDHLMGALGEEQHLWLCLEALLAEYWHDREEAYFDIGYKHGRTAGRAGGARRRTSTSRGRLPLARPARPRDRREQRPAARPGHGGADRGGVGAGARRSVR